MNHRRDRRERGGVTMKKPVLLKANVERSQSEAIPPFDIQYSVFDILRFAFSFDKNKYT